MFLRVFRAAYFLVMDLAQTAKLLAACGGNSNQPGFPSMYSKVPAKWRKRQ